MDRVERHDTPEPIEKPVCPICGQELDSRGVCMDRCSTPPAKTDRDTKPQNVRHG